MPYRAHPDTCVGHVHLKVSDLERSVAFYRDVLGFDLTQRYGAQAAFMSAGTYHHHLGKAGAARLRVAATPDFTTWRFFIPTAPRWVRLWCR